MAERAPTTTLACPLAIICQKRWRSVAVEPAVQNRDAAEAGGEAANRLRRQRDLRHQHDRAASGIHHLPDAPEINLRLAAARDAEQQVDREGADVDSRPKIVKDFLLTFVQDNIRHFTIGDRSVIGKARKIHLLRDANNAKPRQLANGRRRDIGLARQAHQFNTVAGIQLKQPRDDRFALAPLVFSNVA